jgi:HlyD family secretion protein
MVIGAKERKQLVIGVAVLIVLLGFAAVARTLIRQSRGPIAEDYRKANRVARYAGAGAPSNLIEGNGVVEPLEPESRLGADVPGRIMTIYVKEGDTVEKGALLAEVENAMQRAAMARAEAETVASASELRRTQHGMRASDVNAFEAEATSAKARAALAASEQSRAQELAAKGSIASAELENATKRMEAEGAAARAAAERASSARAGGRQEDISIGEARVKASTAVLEEARGALRRTQIFAPTSGRILRIKLHVGEYHNPAAEPLIVMGDVSKIHVRVDVDERDVERVAKNAVSYVTAPAFGEKQFNGKVVEIGQRMGRRTLRVDDPKDRVDVKVLEAVLELEGTPPLVPGMRVSAFIQVKPQ